LSGHVRACATRLARPGRYAELMVDAITFVDRPQLRRPSLICAFRGWNDGGEAASTAATYLVERWKGRAIAYLDPEEFYDFQVTRPLVRLEEGVSRVIEWPRGEFSRVSSGDRDAVIFVAHEPNVRWRTFADAVVHAGRAVGSELLVTLGAFLTDVPHSRPVPVVGSAASEEASERLGLSRSQYEGPTGITGVLHDASIRSGLASVSLWAAVPHYLPSGPNPKAALALVERASALLEMPVDTTPLREEAGKWEEEVQHLLEGSDELAEYVGRLEAAVDSGGGMATPTPIPSADAIAAEVERFLREQGQA
jgi:predicted ATP-grasp superfamily ATP-dependent carboligase